MSLDCFKSKLNMRVGNDGDLIFYSKRASEPRGRVETIVEKRRDVVG